MVTLGSIFGGRGIWIRYLIAGVCPLLEGTPFLVILKEHEKANHQLLGSPKKRLTQMWAGTQCFEHFNTFEQATTTP